MKPQMSPSENFDKLVLQCPKCKSSLLHQGVVEIFEREEDQKTGTHIIIKKRVVTSDDQMSGNPSLRRHGLTIDFRCELCTDIFRLKIAQHKGETLIGW